MTTTIQQLDELIANHQAAIAAQKCTQIALSNHVVDVLSAYDRDFDETKHQIVEMVRAEDDGFFCVTWEASNFGHKVLYSINIPFGAFDEDVVAVERAQRKAELQRQLDQEQSNMQDAVERIAHLTSLIEAM